MRLFSFLFFTWLFGPFATGDQQGSPPPASASPVPTVTTLSLAKVPLEAESTMAILQDLNSAQTRDQAELEQVAGNLAKVTAEIDARGYDDTRLLRAGPSLEMLNRLAASWADLRDTLSAMSRNLSQLASSQQENVGRLDQIGKTWQATLSAAKEPGTPAGVLNAAQRTSDAVESARKTLESDQATALTVQTRLSEAEARARTALASVEKSKSGVVASIFIRDSPPLWSPASGLAIDWAQRCGKVLSYQLVASRAFAERLPFPFLTHFLSVVIIAAVLEWTRRRIRKAPETIEDLNRAKPVFDLPIVAALGLSLLFVPSIYPEAPRLIQTIMAMVALVPTIIILRRLLDPTLHPVLTGLVIIFFVSQVHSLLASVADLERLIFLGQMLGVSIFLFWLLRSLLLKKPSAVEGGREFVVLRAFAKIGIILLPLAFVANVAGYNNFGTILGNFFLRTVYLAAALYTGIRIVEALVIVGLQVKPLGSLHAVRMHRSMLHRRTCRVLEVLAFIFWLNLVLNYFGLRSPLMSGFAAVLNAKASIGSLDVSLGRIVAFVIAVWAAFLISRFLRFVLEEDVYHHFRLPRGVPYAISTSLHYSTLLLGFFVGLGALGIDLTKITILAGAFSVGIGFGLQNVINNFVSGLILLFERPIKIGDVIEVGGNIGEVRQIGIRASVIRTAEGSEIIVPNGLLISSQVTNWTFSDRRRSIEVSVSVAANADLARVTGLLKEAALNQPGVAKEPEPQAFVVSFTTGAVALQLRAWIDRYQDWTQVRSDLTLAINNSLARENIAIA
jgi:potassium efflux system protein